MLTAGTHSGGELAFPQFGIAVRYGMRDVLLADGSQWHGNLPIHGIAGRYNRLSLIFYLREGMAKACPAATAASSPRLRPQLTMYRSHRRLMSQRWKLLD